MVVVSVLLLLTTCTGEEGRAVAPEVEVLPDGRVRVTYAALPLRTMDARLIAEWNLWDPDGAYIFNRVPSVVGGRNTFFLLDAGNRQVVELRPGGSLVRAFGEEGSGPGELRYPTHLDFRGGEVWVADVGNRRFEIYTLDGRYLKDRKWPGAARIVNPFRVLDSGDVLHGGSWPLTVAELADHDPVFYLARFRLGERPAAAAGQGVADTLVVMPSAPFLATPMTSREGRAQLPVFGTAAFSAELHWSAAGSRVVTVTGEKYRFEIRDSRGRILREVALPAPGISVTEQHRRWFWDNRFPLLFVDREPYQPSAGSKARFPFAERLQAIDGIALDRRGRIWVLANLPGAGKTRLDLFDGEGIYLGSLGDLPLPVAFTAGGAVLFRDPAPDGLDRFRVYLIDTGEPEEGKRS